jgi:hypothetical protein
LTLLKAFSFFEKTIGSYFDQVKIPAFLDEGKFDLGASFFKITM